MRDTGTLVIKPIGKILTFVVLYRKLLNGWGKADRQHPLSNLQSSQVALLPGLRHLKNIGENKLAVDNNQIIWSNYGSGTVRVYKIQVLIRCESLLGVTHHFLQNTSFTTKKRKFLEGIET
ncbi:hypothetical protein QT995_21525 [Microcoleus sp. S36b_A3]|uniref:hypothetical protein n=1 Tax=Microcoleaceae TaxID=1892252 RepID=UPI002FD653F4